MGFKSDYQRVTNRIRELESSTPLQTSSTVSASAASASSDDDGDVDAAKGIAIAALVICLLQTVAIAVLFQRSSGSLSIAPPTKMALSMQNPAYKGSGIPYNDYDDINANYDDSSSQAGSDGSGSAIALV